MGTADRKFPASKSFDLTKAYSSLSLFRAGPRLHQDSHSETNCFSAKFQLEWDISALFPYINAEIDGAQYHNKPEYIKFLLDNHLCALYPQEGAFTPVENHADAVEFLQILLNFLIDLDDRREKITPSFRRYNPVSPLDILSLLPSSNCRDCGYSTCLAFAAALSRQYTSPLKCPHLANPVEEKSTFRVVDGNGQHKRTVSLAIDTSCLRREVSEKQAHIETLQARLAAFELRHADTIAEANARLISPLTRREIEVLELVAHGATNKEISNKLNISEHTVKSHVIHIFDKLGVNDRTQASVWAVKNGLL